LAFSLTSSSILAGTIEVSKMPFLWIFSATGKDSTSPLGLRATIIDISFLKGTNFSTISSFPEK
jgi:hypothetical protein